jgi:hypothetical protein
MEHNAIATFAAPKNISSDRQMIFKLTVKNGENRTSTDGVKATDKYIPPPPIAYTGIDQTAHSGVRVSLDGTCNAGSKKHVF